MYPAVDLCHLDRLDILADLLSKGPRNFERTEIPLLSEPEPCAESIVSSAEDFRTARSERAQSPIRTRALQEERCLRLIELAGDRRICPSLNPSASCTTASGLPVSGASARTSMRPAMSSAILHLRPFLSKRDAS
jgi:hypothetical protein